MTKDEALKMAIEWFDMAEMDINDGAYRMALPIIKACKEALSATPSQSLIEHDNEVIERCAKVFKSELVRNEIRALKGNV